MRLPLPIVLTCLASVTTAQAVRIDTYWLRDSGAKTFDDMAPFRIPKGLPPTVPGQLRDLLVDLQEMRRIATAANKLQLKSDEEGREICSITGWGRAYENVKANSLKMAGWLGVVLRDDTSVAKRRTAIYGMVYFNDPQEVIGLISMLPGEPLRDLREDGFQRALRFLKVHYPKSKPQNARFPDNGIVVPKYTFNPQPFFQLLDQENDLDKAQGLWFLTEVLRIRPDLGRVYLEELQEKIPALLTSGNQTVRKHAVEFLSRIERKRERVMRAEASNAELQKWLKEIQYDLFPPIRHRSLGLVELYSSDDLKAIIKTGKNVLFNSILPPGSTKTKSGSVRYGVRLARIPEPLDKLGLPKNAIVVAVNAYPVRSAKDLRKAITDHLDEFKPKKDAKGKTVPGRKGNPAFQIEYIHKGKAMLKEFRVMEWPLK